MSEIFSRQLNLPAIFHALPRTTKSSFITHSLQYRAFHNVLRDYRNLLQENRWTSIYETYTDRKKLKKFFPLSCFSS